MLHLFWNLVEINLDLGLWLILSTNSTEVIEPGVMWFPAIQINERKSMHSISMNGISIPLILWTNVRTLNTKSIIAFSSFHFRPVSSARILRMFENEKSIDRFKMPWQHYHVCSTTFFCIRLLSFGSGWTVQCTRILFGRRVNKHVIGHLFEY